MRTRIALISDLHGNEVALAAVLADVRRAGVDQIVCLGDVATLGPRPSFVLHTLRDLGCLCIMGNHDEFLLEAEMVHGYSEAPIIAQAVDWCRAELSADELDFVRTFQRRAELPLGRASRLLVFHGSPTSHMQDLLATTPPDELDRLLAGHGAPVMAGGHTHVQMLRQHRGMLLVNPGSVGMPFEEYVNGRAPRLMPHAEYATVDAQGDGDDVRVTLHRVPLDKATLRASLSGSTNPMAAGLLREWA
jgi:putative phosphoesterase